MGVLIDPPGGWRYGFPKLLPNPPPENIGEWLVEKGYPRKEMESYGDFFFCRYIEQTKGKLEE